MTAVLPEMSPEQVRFSERRRDARRHQVPRVKYTQGFCGEFALALHQVTGWPIVVLWDILPPCPTPLSRGSLLHALCRRPDGIYVDALGHHNENGVRVLWQSRYCPIAFWVLGNAQEFHHHIGWRVELPEVEIARQYILNNPQDYLHV